MKKSLSVLFGIALLGALMWGVYWLVAEIWGQFKSLDPKLAVAALTAFTTVTVSTLTVVLRKKGR